MIKWLFILLLATGVKAQDTIHLHITPRVSGIQRDIKKITYMKRVVFWNVKTTDEVKYLKAYYKPLGELDYYVDEKGKRFYSDAVLRIYERIDGVYIWADLINFQN